MTAQILDVAELRRLVDGQDGSSGMRHGLVSWLNGHAPAILAALTELEELRQRVAALEIALRHTDARMWSDETGYDEEPDGTWRPLSVREQRRVNALLLGPPMEPPARRRR